MFVKSSNMAIHYKTLFNFENIGFFNYSYFAKIMSRKPKIGNMTNMTELYPFLESKSGICYLRGFCSDVMSHENQEYTQDVYDLGEK